MNYLGWDLSSAFSEFGQHLQGFFSTKLAAGYSEACYLAFKNDERDSMKNSIDRD